MAFTVTVACPHCGLSATHTINSSQSGNTGVQCNKCHKTFRIYYTNGQFKEVRLH